MDMIRMKGPMFPNTEPNENSSLDELGAYAFLKQEQVLGRDKMNAEDLWLMGQALAWAKKQKPHGGWEKWFKSQGLKKTYVWQARTLHDKATLDEVEELGLTEALRKFGVLVEKKPKPAEEKTTKVTPPTPASNDGATEPTDEDNGGDPTESEENADDNDPDGDEKPTDDLADEEEREFKAYQDALRQRTPKTRAVAIQHALELLRDDLDEEEIDEELQSTFGQIAELAEKLKGLSERANANEAS